MSITTLDERLELMRIGDEVEVVFLEINKKLSTYTSVILEGENVKGDGSVKNPRKIWVSVDETRRPITDDNGVLVPGVIRVTFIRHSQASQVKKRSVPVPKPPLNKPAPVKAKFPIPRDPRTIGQK